MLPVTLAGITKRFGNTLALDHISLSIQAGELFFLLGPSGCGKTTLLRAIAGFVRLDEGQILFGEENVINLPPHQRRTAMMFQNYALWPHMSVAANVAFGLEEAGIPAADRQRRVHKMLELVKMRDHASRRPNELSGGEQQRVALGRALIVRPRCLLLDEPLSNLDAKLRLEMRAEIRRLVKESGVTAIYVTHDQKEAISVADRIAVLNRGRVAQIGTPREIYHRPQSRFVASFVGEANFLCGKITWATNERAKIDIGTHELLGILNDSNWRPKAAEFVLVMIRPESIRLSADGIAANSFRGRITETAYLGEIAQYEFATRHFTFKIHELNPRFTAQSGRTELYAHVDPADVIILPAEQNS